MDDLVIATSRYAFAQTVERVVAAIRAGGATLFAQLDQRAAAEFAGLSLRPTMLLIFGNPKAGTRLMNDYPLFALELPLKLLVWEAEGQTNIAYPSMRKAALRYALPAGDGTFALLDRFLDDIGSDVRV